MKRTISLAAVTAFAFAATALAQQPKDEATDDKPAKTLSVGDKAPAINIEHWVKGDKVEKFENGKVYVVEFWATWCGPCRESMPHISKLQTELKDYGVTFVGISDEPLETVTGFLGKPRAKGSDETWNDVIAYNLTTDPDKSAHNDYMKAAGQNGIPTAFIVGKDQHVEWIGHPMNIDKPLDSVVKDSWDRAAFKKEFDAEQAAASEMMKVRQELFKAMQDEEWDKALAMIDPVLAKNPKDLNAGMTKFQILTRKGDTQAAHAFARELAKNNWDNAMVLNAVAWTIVEGEDVDEQDADVALEFAARANTLSEQKNPAILDTLARCYYEKGDLANAVKYQQIAVKSAGADEMGTEIKETLKKYQDELAKKGG